MYQARASKLMSASLEIQAGRAQINYMAHDITIVATCGLFA